MLLAIGAAFISLPEKLPIKFTIGALKVDTVLAAPRINTSIFGYQITKDFKTHLGLDLQGGTHLVLEADMKDIDAASRDTALESSREVIERRINFFGLSEPTVQTAKVDQSYRIIVELPGISEVDAAVTLIGQTAQLEFREFTESTPSSIPHLLNTKETGIKGSDLKRASLAFHQTTGKPVVEFELTVDGAKKFGDLTTRLVGRPLAIFLDEVPISWPIIQEPITDGRGIISGSFTKDQAKRLGLQLSAGALPTPVKIIEQRSIGPTLGQESITKSMRAGIIGLLLVILFMVVSYGYIGLLAVAALLIYGVVSFALYRAIPITLTLPGIAGFILSIGMAVDSNILIFERIKEELRNGKSWELAMEQGFGKAWDSIRDANFATIMAALILYNPLNSSWLPVSGIVRGFALTLGLGVVLSLFTGIVVTRTLIRVLYRRKTL